MTRAGIDRCLARGCGGQLVGVDFGDFSDGDIVECRACGRLHWLLIDEHGKAWSRAERARDCRRRREREMAARYAAVLR